MPEIDCAFIQRLEEARCCRIFIHGLNTTLCCPILEILEKEENSVCLDEESQAVLLCFYI